MNVLKIRIDEIISSQAIMETLEKGSETRGESKVYNYDDKILHERGALVTIVTQRDSPNRLYSLIIKVYRIKSLYFKD